MRCTLLVLVAMILALVPARAAQSWHESYFPNVELTDQDGKAHKFYDDVIKGKVVALNFIYTKCTDVCPVDTAQLRQVAELLGDKLGRDIHFYSISIDPENDTPEALRRYRHTFDIADKGWTFLTGKKDEIDLLRRKLGLIGANPEPLKQHNTSLIIGNEKTAQWIKRSPYDHPKILANLLSEGLRNYITAGGEQHSYAEASRITGVTRGQTLFSTRCQACHTIGGGDKLGPDLKGVVAARDRAWLTRWLKEPNKMIEEKDPVVLGLMSRYRNLPMPNLGLGDVDAEALIEYMSGKDASLAREGRRHAN
jgi:protein SCO1